MSNITCADMECLTAAGQGIYSNVNFSVANSSLQKMEQLPSKDVAVLCPPIFFWQKISHILKEPVWLVNPFLPELKEQA